MNNKKNISLKFLAVVVLVYIVLAFFNIELFYESINRFGEMMKTIFPLLGVVFAIMFLTNKFLTDSVVKKHLGNESGVKAYFYTIIAGILIGGPPYVLFPLLKDLKEKGMSDTLIAVFLYNRNVKIPFIPAMIYYFGLAFTVILSVYVVIFSVISGLIINKIKKA